MSKRQAVVYGILVFFVGFGMSMLVQRRRVISADKDFFAYYAAVRQTIDETYLGVGEAKTPPERQLAYGALKGLVRSLNDPYSVFLTPDETKFLDDQSAGSFAGIGVTLRQENASSIRIIDVAKDSPAQKAGLSVGDTIVAIGGVSVSEYSLIESIMHIRGKAGETVELTVLRKDASTPKVFKIKREDRISAELHVAARREGTVGIIILPEFGTKSTDEFYAAAERLLKEGASAFILDLRGNLGGSVRTSVEIASAWAQERRLVIALKSKNGQTEYFSKPSGVSLAGKRTVVLVNGSTASAAEVVMGALQDWDAATAIGTTTFGKGVAQSVIPFPDGSSLRLTTARWYTPKGREIHGKGMKPNIEVSQGASGAEAGTAKRDVQMERALAYLVTGK